MDLPDASLIKNLEKKILNFSEEYGWFEPTNENCTNN
jgi:hypothetical protein